MREVEYRVYEAVDGKNQYITKTGRFHQWGETATQESGDFNDGGWKWIQYTMAIIETENGQIVMVAPESVKFKETK